MAQADAYDVAVASEHDDFQVRPHQFDTQSHRNASAMRHVKCIRLEVRGRNPRRTAYATAENEPIQIFVAHFMDGSEKSVHNRERATARAEWRLNVS
jgi:hypothetical protein